MKKSKYKLIQLFSIKSNFAPSWWSAHYFSTFETNFVWFTSEKFCFQYNIVSEGSMSNLYSFLMYRLNNVEDHVYMIILGYRHSFDTSF